jgi:DNA ligase-1
MTKQLAPMLAIEADMEKIKFPIGGQPKYDGIRTLRLPEGQVSRTLKRIPNHFVQTVLDLIHENNSMAGFDSEIVSYVDGKRRPLNEVQSDVMSADGEFDFILHVFDLFEQSDRTYVERHNEMVDRVAEINSPYVEAAPFNIFHNLEDFKAYEDGLVVDGWEGAIGRDPQGTYKYGRSTINEGKLLKVKRFTDSEALLIGMVERNHNENEAKVDKLGKTKRSSAKAGKVPAGDMGAMILRWPNGVEFELGTGFTAKQRRELWARRDTMIGESTITFKYKELGPNGKPLILSFYAVRLDYI